MSSTVDPVCSRLQSHPFSLSGAAGSDPPPPSKPGKEQDTGLHRLIKDLQHVAAHTEQSFIPNYDYVYSKNSSLIVLFGCRLLLLNNKISSD